MDLSLLKRIHKEKNMVRGLCIVSIVLASIFLCGYFNSVGYTFYSLHWLIGSVAGMLSGLLIEDE